MGRGSRGPRADAAQSATVLVGARSIRRGRGSTHAIAGHARKVAAGAHQYLDAALADLRESVLRWRQLARAEHVDEAALAAEQQHITQQAADIATGVGNDIWGRQHPVYRRAGEQLGVSDLDGVRQAMIYAVAGRLGSPLTFMSISDFDLLTGAHTTAKAQREYLIALGEHIGRRVDGAALAAQLGAGELARLDEMTGEHDYKTSAADYLTGDEAQGFLSDAVSQWLGDQAIGQRKLSEARYGSVPVTLNRTPDLSARSFQRSLTRSLQDRLHDDLDSYEYDLAEQQDLADYDDD